MERSRHTLERFLNDVLAGRATAAHWEEAVATHYTDLDLEHDRVQAVRLLLSRPPGTPLSRDTVAQLEQLRDRLRGHAT